MKSENWKTEFKSLEDAENWHPALELLLKVIEKNQDEKDAYIFMHYFFMNLFLEADDYDLSKNEYYKSICLEYFKIAYEKYKNDAEYLFWTSIPLCHCPWYFGINDDEQYKRMAEKACLLDKNNYLYKNFFFIYTMEAIEIFENEFLKEINCSYRKACFRKIIRKEKLEFYIYTQEMSDENSEIRKEIASKGSLGEYFMKMRHFNIEESLQYKEL